MKDRLTAGVLALVLGGLGVHKFYLGRTGQGILYLLFFWTFIPAIIGFIEGILYLVMEQSAFDAKYNKAKLAPSPHEQVMAQADLLLKFKQLHTAGAITDEEFEAAKRRALGMREPS